MLEKNFTWSTPINSGICNIEVRNTLPYKLARYYEEMRTVERSLEPMPFLPEQFAAGGILIDEIRRTGIRITH
jgi:hypothetical protein